MKIHLNPHTVYLMVGPSGCGKSHLANNIAQNHTNCVVISSDDCRYELLGGSGINKMDPRMLEISRQAFDLLLTKLESHITYPVNTKSVILDTTGLDEKFRNKIAELCKKNNYNLECIAYIFKDRQDYFKNCLSRNITNRQITKLFKTEVKSLTKKLFKEKYVVSKFNENIEIIDNINNVVDCNNLPNQETIIVSDIHGCWEEFVELLGKNNIPYNPETMKFDIPDTTNVVLLGDIIDKNTPENIRKTVDIVFANLDRLFVIKGNHENFVYKYWKNPEILQDENVLREFFNSIYIKDIWFRELLNTITETSFDYLKLPGFIISHSPCEKKYLEKDDPFSLKMQRNLRHSNLSNKEILDIIYNYDNNACYPTHICGHIASERIIKTKNTWIIDTGCYAGNKLTAVIIKPNQRNPFISQVNAKHVYKKENLLTQNDNVLKTISDYKNSDNYINIKRRFERILKNKVQFISGTMSPVDKFNDILENLEWGLNYYKDNKIENIVLQRKEMGSRCQLYIYENIDKCFATSRQGFLIPDQVDLIPTFEKYINKFQESFDRGLEYRILDGELLPWSALGLGLINETFYASYELIKEENNFSNSLGFHDAFKKLESSIDKFEYGKSSKSEFIKKHGHHNFENCKNYHEKLKREFENYNILEHTSWLENFKTEIDKYSEIQEPSYYPFTVLKDGYKETTPLIYGYGFSNFKLFHQVNDDINSCIQIELNRPNEEIIDIIKLWVDNYVNTCARNEGIVMKPETITKGVAPYLKVRNPVYLTMAYGYDYICNKNKYSKLFNRKKVNRKISLSIKEFELGLDMLNYFNDTETSPEFINSCLRMMEEEMVEKQLDPRL